MKRRTMLGSLAAAGFWPLAPTRVAGAAGRKAAGGERRAARLRVAGAQIPVLKDVAANVAAIERAIGFAAREQADILVTPEGSLSGYRYGFDPSAVVGALERVTARARDARVALALGVCFEEADGQRYNEQRFYGKDGGFLGFHTKILLGKDLRHPERVGEFERFRSKPLRTFQLDGLTIGGLICNDLWANPMWSPQDDPHLSMQLARMGARVIFHSVNSGQGTGDEHAVVLNFHESNLRMRARAGRQWIVVTNAADPEGRLPSNAPCGVVRPDGGWAIKIPPVGEQFFAHTIDIEVPAHTPQPA